MYECVCVYIALFALLKNYTMYVCVYIYILMMYADMDVIYVWAWVKSFNLMIWDTMEVQMLFRKSPRERQPKFVR